MDEDIRQRLEGRRYAEAFELVLDRYQDKVFRLAFSMMRNEAQAQDATQDVFVRIWKGLPGYNAGAALSTWIYTITRNTCLTELKKRSMRPTVSLQEPALEAVADRIPALQSADPEPGREMDVAAMLSELPENYRRVITLFYLEQKSYVEVAAMLGLPHICPATRSTRCGTGARSVGAGCRPSMKPAWRGSGIFPCRFAGCGKNWSSPPCSVSLVGSDGCWPRIGRISWPGWSQPGSTRTCPSLWRSL